MLFTEPFLTGCFFSFFLLSKIPLPSADVIVAEVGEKRTCFNTSHTEAGFADAGIVPKCPGASTLFIMP